MGQRSDSRFQKLRKTTVVRVTVDPISMPLAHNCLLVLSENRSGGRVANEWGCSKAVWVRILLGAVLLLSSLRLRYARYRLFMASRVWEFMIPIDFKCLQHCEESGKNKSSSRIRTNVVLTLASFVHHSATELTRKQRLSGWLWSCVASWSYRTPDYGSFPQFLKVDIWSLTHALDACVLRFL